MGCSIVALNVLQVLGGGCQIQWKWRSDCYIKSWLIGRKVMEKQLNRHLKNNWPLQKIRYQTIILFFVTPKFCISIVFGFFWELKWPQWNWKQCLCKLLGWQTKNIMVCYGIFRRGQLQSLTRDGCLQQALSKVIWLRKLWCSIWVVAFERWLHLEVHVIYQDSSTWLKWSSVVSFWLRE